MHLAKVKKKKNEVPPVKKTAMIVVQAMKSRTRAGFLVLAASLLWLQTSWALSDAASSASSSLLDDSGLADEENDAKLFLDMVESVRQWAERKKEKNRKRSNSHIRQKRDEEVVCYGDLGCFRDEGFFFDYLDMLPSPPEEVNTKFFLYTRNNEELPNVITYNNITSVQESNFNVSNPLKMIIHGFGSGCNKVWPKEMRLSFLKVEDCNVFCVDWSAGAADPNYVRAAVNTRLVGKQLSLFITMLNENFGVDLNVRTHLIGFSLGAHVAGFAGSELTNLSRITGLDPAGPFFEGFDPKVRLDSGDAAYVDVIHSNGESLMVGGFGFWEAIGHVDFYPNGGRAQRGCQHLLIGGLYDFIYSYSSSNETYRYLCNHRRAYKLFTNSISRKCQFTAFPCESYEKFESGACFSCSSALGECGQLGYYSDLAPGRGSLYLLTMDEEPFCGNQYKVNIMFTSTRVPIQTYGRLQMLFVDKNGLNETHQISTDVDDLLTSGSQMEKLVVVHPAIQPVEVWISYVAYEGWIYTGRFQWSLDKLLLTDSFGSKSSFCEAGGRLLPSGKAIVVPLSSGDCAAATRYPIAPYHKYPGKHPHSQLQHIPPPNKNTPSQNKLKPGSGQDVFYVTNTNNISTVITIHDEVAPLSVPEFSNYDKATPKISRPNNTPKWLTPKPPPPQHFRPPPGFLWQPKKPPPDFGPKLSAFPSRRRPSTTQYRPHPPRLHLPLRPRRPDILVTTTLPPPFAEKVDVDVDKLVTVMKDVAEEDQLTIVKIGQNGHRADQTLRSSNNNHSEENVDYIVLHKLPNGEALNLENLRTYSMADIEKGKMPLSDQIDMGISNSFNVNEGNDGVIPMNGHASEHLKEPPERSEQGKLFLDPELYQMTTSESPVKSLKEQLEAMKEPLYELRKEHPYYVNFKDPPAEGPKEELRVPVNNLEVLDLGAGSVSSSEEADPVVSSELEAPKASTPKPSTDSSAWIPIQTSPKPTFGPRNKPPGYISRTQFDPYHISKLTDIAHIYLADVGHLESNNVQQQPFKLSYSDIKERSIAGSRPYAIPGQFRENKIAPVFKQDLRSQARSLEQHKYSKRVFTGLPHRPPLPIPRPSRFIPLSSWRRRTHPPIRNHWRSRPSILPHRNLGIERSGQQEEALPVSHPSSPTNPSSPLAPGDEAGVELSLHDQPDPGAQEESGAPEQLSEDR